MTHSPVQRTVLVIEDDDDVLDLIADVLRDRGHTVHCARNASHALARLHETPFELVLLDLTLPDMSGLEFLNLRERIPHLATIRLVILSGADDADDVGEERKIPVLRKPFRTNELLSFVEGD